MFPPRKPSTIAFEEMPQRGVAWLLRSVFESRSDWVERKVRSDERLASWNATRPSPRARGVRLVASEARPPVTIERFRRAPYARDVTVDKE